MDLNLKFWRAEGETFFQRLSHWLDILDPLFIFASNEKIDKARILLLGAGENVTNSLQDKKIKEAWNLSLASVNPSNGDTIHAIFRPPAFLPLVLPLVLTSTLMNRGISQTLLSQAVFHSYITGFSLANGNAGQKPSETSTVEEKKLFSQKILYSFGAIIYGSFVGTFPHYFLNRFKPPSPSVPFFVRNILPGPLTGLLCAVDVMASRIVESEKGIQVLDSKGNVVGVSKKAAEKAVKETALSRAALLATAVFVPDIAMHFFKRKNTLLKHSFRFTSIRGIIIVFVLGTMIPVSFSWMPQFGKIKRSELEPEIVSSTEESELFYNRGV